MTAKEDIEILLPWYVTGKLSADDKKRVDEYIRAHPDMASQLELIREEEHETIVSNETIAPPSAVVLDTVMAQIEAEEAARPRTVMERLSDLLPTLDPGAMQIAALAAIAVIVAQAIVIGALMTAPGTSGGNNEGFETATGEQAKTRAPDLLISFNQNASAGDITNLLRDMDAAITGGPKAGGIFEISFVDQKPAPDKLQSLVDQLKKRAELVTFVARTN